MRTLFLVLSGFVRVPMLLVVGLVACGTPAQAAIEAVKGKSYRLSSRNGPWVIMVTSFDGETSEQEKNAEQAASELIYQLRRKGIPAYSYRSEDRFEEVSGYDRMGRGTKRKYMAQHGMIGVVAGNYDDIDDWKAQGTLKFVKKFKPKVKVEGPDGKPMEVAMPLGKAFLARNPLLPPDALTGKVRDPLLLKINSRSDYSLFQNKGKYTLVVASFYGNSQVKPKEFDAFAKSQVKGSNISLENAATESELLCRTMRAQKNLDAYVWHDRFRSVVTVGSFQKPDDPEIIRLAQMFQAKYKPIDGSPHHALVAESFQIPGARQGDRPLHAWTMDPEPTVMKVPH